MENLNLAELLKDCPKGMKLYSPIFGDVYLDKIRPHLAIVVTTDKEQGNLKEEFLYDGRYGKNGECMLFLSKGKTTWEGFIPFVKGDIIYTDGIVAILYSITKSGTLWYYCYYSISEDRCKIKTDFGIGNVKDNELRFATEEEKQKLFDAIKANGYKWNAETKTLEKFPKFKVGDRIILKDNPHNIPSIRIKAVTKNQYILENEGFFYISSADEKYVLEDKFNITTLKPFESRVLVRDTDTDAWKGAFYSHYKSKKFYIIGGSYYYQCIPYEGNEHLLDTINDCDPFFKTWEK